MSDLISTPSQTQSIVSNEAFEMLIDLLASDGIDENPATLPGDHSRMQPNMSLRDSSGKLDFGRVRLAFEAKNETHHVSTAPGSLGEEKGRVQSPAMLDEGEDSDDEPHSHRSTSSTVPSRSNSMSPKPAERPATGHRRSSTFGNQPWVATHENEMAAKEDVLSTPLQQPLSFDELNTALAGAYEEVTKLRQQYDELQALVFKRLGAATRDQVKRFPGVMNTEKGEPGTDNRHVETRDAGSRVQPSVIVPRSLLPDVTVPAGIASLSEIEAKRTLSALARSLNLSASTIGSTASPSTATVSAPLQQDLSPLNPTQQYDVAPISRAVKFLGMVDELVWRRASGLSGPRTLPPVFSEENIVALVARLELWERAVRRPPRV